MDKYLKNETFTFHTYGKKLGLTNKLRFRIGKEISDVYFKIYNQRPEKVDRRKKHKSILWVNEYPAEFRVIVDNILKSHGLEI